MFMTYRVFNLRGWAFVSCLLCLWFVSLPVLADDALVVPDTLYADQLRQDAYMLSAAGSVAQPLHRAPRIAKASPVPASQCLLDSIIGCDHDGNPTARTYYRYDSRRYQVSEESYTLTNGTWVGKSRSENAYDDAGRTLLTATYTWRNGAWAGTAKTVNTYDAAGRNTDTQAFLWSSTANDWTNNYRYAYTYDAAGNKTASSYYKGNGVDWVPANRYEYAYDAARREVLNIYYGAYDAVSGTWIGSTKVEKTFDNRGNITLQSDYIWSSTNNDWEGKKRISATFNTQNKKTQETKYTWRNGGWVNQSRTDTEYDEQGRVISSASYRWRNDAWEGNGSKTEYVYSGNTTATTLTYDWKDGAWAYSAKTENTTNAQGGKVTISYVFDNGAWVGKQRTDNTIDVTDGGNITTVELWNEGQWVVAQRTKSVTVKNSKNLPVRTTDYVWKEDAWVPNGVQTVYTYDEQGHCLSQVRSQYTNGEWKDIYKSNYQYKANHQISEESYTWAGSRWVGSKKTEADYDDQGRQTMTATYDWSGDKWVGGTKHESVYNAKGQKEEELSYTWNWNSNQWTNLFRRVYTYDAKGRKTVDVHYSGNGDEWQPASRDEFLFDSSNRQYETRESEWYNGDWSLRNLSSTTYDAHSRKTAVLAARYSGGVLQSWQNDVYTYDCGTRYGVAPATTICEGDSALFHGRYYHIGGIYFVTIPATEAFYDSVVTWTLNVQSPVTAPAEQLTLCANQLPYHWHTLTCDTAGTYRDTAYYAMGCDSVYYTLHLTVNQPSASDTAAAVCAGELPYVWYDQTLTAAGTYTRTITNTAGCDSVITLHLTVNQPTAGDTAAIVCAGELPYVWYDQTLTAAGTYIRTTVNTAGCDSVITLHLTVNQPTASTAEETVHATELPYVWHNQSLTDEGTYTYTTTNAVGCDSIITLLLHVEREVRMWLTVREGEVLDSIYTLLPLDTIHIKAVFDPASVRPQVLSYSVMEGHSLITLHNTLDAWGGIMLITHADPLGGTAVVRGTAQVADAWHTARLILHVMPRTTTGTGEIVNTAAPARRLVWRNGTIYIECRTARGVEYYTLQGQKVEPVGD